MFDGDEITHSIVLISDGSEIYAVPVERVGVEHWKTKDGWKPQKLEGLSVCAVALSIDGAGVA